MPNASVELRVYCICGQKMKVTEDMFGLPAKCVACRRKIRIPARDDVAPDVNEIHLKDHPEFLRKPKKPRKTQAVARRTATPVPKNTDKAVVPVCAAEHAGKIAELLRPLPLDILEPLQQIVSLRNKVLRELRKTKGHGHDNLEERRTALKAHLQKLDEARAYLDNEIRQKRMEVGTELASVREKVVQTGLLARLEEINFTTYQSMTTRLRRKRDSLERLYYDLGAWLDVRDPRAAGGYVSLPFESIPARGFDVEWPDLTPDASTPLLEQHTHALHQAFAAREMAKDKLAETAKLRADGEVSAANVAGIRADAKVEKRRAEAEITYRRKRLDEFGQDTAGDVQTIHACLERARKRSEEGALEKPAFEAVEHELLRAKRDCAKAHDVVTRALIASTSKDVPDLKGVYLERLAAPPPDLPQKRRRFSAVLAYDSNGLGLDSWVAWASVLMLAASIFLPLVGELSPLQACSTLAYQGSGVYWIAAAPLLAAFIILAAGAVPRRHARGYLQLAVWLVLTVTAVTAIHESHYSAGAVAERFNKAGNWLFRPGAILMVLANLALLAAACIALWTRRRAWLALIVCAAVIVALSAVVGSNFMGSAVPRPTLAVDSLPSQDPANPSSEVTVTVGNLGKRSLFLSAAQSSARNAFVFQVQRQDGPGWEDVAIQHVQLNRQDYGADNRAPSHFRTLAIRPGAAAEFTYLLLPAEYRVQLVDASGAREPLVSLLSIAAPEPPPAAEPVALPAESEPEPASMFEAPAPPLPVQVELKGIIIGPDNEPRFSVTVLEPGKAPDSVNAMLGDKIYGDWMIAEFNRLRQTVTLTKDGYVLIMSRNRPLPLVTGAP